jgi:hypothetical protein
MRNQKRRFNITLDEHRELSNQLRQAAWHVRQALRLLAGKRGVSRVGDVLVSLLWKVDYCTGVLYRAMLKEHSDTSDGSIYDWGKWRLGPRPDESVEQPAPAVYVIGDDAGADMVSKYGKPR